jgi:hypothetical protein
MENKEMSAIKTIATLKNWSYAALNSSPYTAPEAIICGFTGNVYNHPNYCNGTTVGFEFRGDIEYTNNQLIVYSTSGRKYILESVDEEYAKSFPNWHETLINKAKEVIE